MSGSPSLRELIDIDELQSIQDDFARAIGISSVILSPEGEPLTKFTNPTGFCSLIQSTEKGRERCFRSFMEMGKIALGSEKPEIFYCFAHGGHFVAPIIVDGEHKGTMFAGQFIPEKFSSEQIRNLEEIAHEIDLDPGLLVKEAEKMRVVGEAVIRNYSTLLFKIVETIARRGVQAAELIRAKDALEKAHEALELRFRDIAGAMSDWVWEVDAGARYTYCSEKVKDVLGYSADEMIGKTPFDLMIPDETDSVGAVFAELVRERRPIRSMENWLRTRDGRSVCMSTSGVPILDDAGELLGYRGVDSDITERKKAEEALKDRVEFEKIVTAISTSFINLAPDEVDAGIEDALGSIGEFSGVDRSYIFQFTDDKTTMDNTHEWCARGVVPQIENLKGLQTADFPWLMPQLNRFLVVHIPVVADLPPDADATKEILQSQDILSVILVPMVYGGTLIGYLGFDSVRQEKRWSEDDIALLKVVGEIFVNALEHRRAMDVIKDSEEKYRLLADNTADCIWQMNLDFEFTYVNPSILQMLGFTQDEWIGSSLSDHCSPEDVELASGIAKESLKKNSGLSSATFEIRLLHKNGKVVTAEINSKILFDEDGNPVRVQGSTRDITERKAAENALRESEEKYRNIIENIQDIFYRADMEGNLVMISSSGAKQMGYDSVEAMIGLNVAKTFYAVPEERDGFLKVLGKAGVVNDYEITLKKKDGTLVPVRASSQFYFDKSGNPLGVEGLLSDITERKRAEQKIENLQQYNRGLIEVSIDLLVTFDHKGILMDVNGAMIQAIGRTREELVGTPFADYFTDPERAYKSAMLTFEIGGVRDYELIMKTSDGTETIVSYNTSVYRDQTGDVVGAFAAARDITERKAAEEEIKKKTKELEGFNKLAVGRELKMIELKKEINALLGKLGAEPGYEIAGES